ETVHEEKGDRVERAATTAASLDTKQDSGTINMTQSTTIPNEPIPQGTGSGGSPRCQDTILGDRPDQTRFERLSKQSYEPPLSRVNILGNEDLIIAQTLMKMRSVKSKEKSKENRVSSTRLKGGVLMREASETASRLIVSPQQQLDPKDKAKGIMQEPEKPVKVKGKDQIALDEEVS
nr:hypothetical protein [Tanacetum cinerariifolium]